MSHDMITNKNNIIFLLCFIMSKIVNVNLTNLISTLA